MERDEQGRLGQPGETCPTDLSGTPARLRSIFECQHCCSQVFSMPKDFCMHIVHMIHSRYLFACFVQTSSGRASLGFKSIAAALALLGADPHRARCNSQRNTTTSSGSSTLHLLLFRRRPQDIHISLTGRITRWSSNSPPVTRACGRAFGPD